MSSLRELRGEIERASGTRASRAKWIGKFVQIALVISGSTIIGICAHGAGSFTWPPQIWVVGTWCGVALVAIGSIALTLYNDTSDHLDKAREAISLAEERADVLQDMIDDGQFLEDSVEKLRSLYMIHSATRHFIERTLTGDHANESEVIEAVLKAARHDLRVALGFEINDTWTIVVYRSERRGDGYRYLKCVAHDRSVDCDISAAREWREGIGVGGMALLKDDEVAAPDITHESARSLFRLTNGTFREQDLVRYRSLLAVPVNVGNDGEPWGVVLATSNRPNHFRAAMVGRGDEAAPNEAISAFAGIVALAVAAQRCSDVCVAAPKGDKKEKEKLDERQQD